MVGLIVSKMGVLVEIGLQVIVHKLHLNSVRGPVQVRPSLTETSNPLFLKDKNSIYDHQVWINRP